MSDIAQEIAALQKDVAARTRAAASAQAAQSQAEGRQAATLADLQAEFGVSTIEEARDTAGRVRTAMETAVTRARQELAQAGGDA